jgi:glutathione S-transferase
MRPRLITIPISHYCEKARWALDRAAVGYDEHPHVQFAHIWHARRAGGGRTVPVLVTADGTLRASADILAWADRRLPEPERLYPAAGGDAARALEARFDAGLGPDGRLWMYHATLPVVREMAPWALAGVPARERRAFARFGGALDPAIRRYLGVSAAGAHAALERVRADFEHVAALLADGRPHLLGERFTAADLTFAALSAAVLIPADYGSPLPPLEVLPAAMGDEVRRLREHPAGRYAAALYATQRRRTVG